MDSKNNKGQTAMSRQLGHFSWSVLWNKVEQVKNRVVKQHHMMPLTRYCRN